MEKIAVGVLGATGMVGQNYIALLRDHPWYEVRYIAASPRSAGKKYRDAIAGRQHIEGLGASAAGDLVVQDANDTSAAAAASRRGECAFVFSALELGRAEIAALEEAYAAAGVPVISNASAHRFTPDVPMLIGEVNPAHAALIDVQRKERGWKKGFIAVKPNCSIQCYTMPVFALIEAGFSVKRLIVTTIQAVSGAGYPGVSSLDVLDNLVPYIAGEEEKSEEEPLKILGRLADGRILNAAEPKISAACNRAAIVDGHTACVSLEFGEKKPSADEVKAIWRAFRGLPQELSLPSAPNPPIVVREERDRPQPRRDRNAGGGMAVSVGRVRPCQVFDLRFTAVSHNTIRGAAGGGILNAELLTAKGYIK